MVNQLVSKTISLIRNNFGNYNKLVVTKTQENISCKERLTGASVSGIPSIAATKMQTTSPMFEDIMYLMNCLVLLYIALPSATACLE